MTGSGMEGLFSVQNKLSVKTDAGPIVVYECRAGETDFFFLPRHGKEHEVVPHAIDHVANMKALQSLGVGDVIATGAVGSISKRLKVGEMGLLDQFIDMSGRRVTAFEKEVRHTDMTNPYDKTLQKKLVAAGRSLGMRLTTGLCYLSVDGPRYETAAEIRAFGLLGADVVGMTGAPEAIVANELGMKYASIVVATNWGAGIQDKVSHDEVVSMMARVVPRLRTLVERAISA